MKENNNINENDLDSLLRDLYLKEKSDRAGENDATFVISQNYNINIDPEKEKALIEKLQKGIKGGDGFNFYFPIFILIGLLTFLVIYHYLNIDESIIYPAKQISQNNKTNTVGDVTSVKKNNSIAVDVINSIKAIDTFGRPATINSISEISTNAIANEKSESEQQSEKREKTVPFITEKDKLRYSAIKDQMLLKLVRSDKGLYTHVDANKLSYASKAVIVDAFTIRNMAITNLEYKTFLADLLIQKRDQDYLTASVSNEGWAKSNCNSLTNLYFQDGKYNDFPVVNITYEAAKLFCKWLEQEAILYIQKNKLKSKTLQIRLPYDEELIYAAREGYAKIAYESGYNTIYDLSEGLVDRSFTNRVELIKKRVKRTDTLYTQFTTNRYGWKETDVLQFFDAGFKYYNTVNADTLFTDRMKVLGKIGRVSEMVTVKNSSRIWLAGLSWKNKEEYLKLENDFKGTTFSPFVGFRPVIIDPNDPEYKNPFW